MLTTETSIWRWCKPDMPIFTGESRRADSISHHITTLKMKLEKPDAVFGHREINMSARKNGVSGIDPEIAGYLWVLKNVNKALLFGLQSAVDTMENWDQMPEEKRESIIGFIKKMIDQGKEAFENIPDMEPPNAETLKH